MSKLSRYLPASAGIFAIVVWLTIVIASVYGYVMNVVHLVRYDHGTGELIARVVGLVFVPLGALMGYL